MTQRNELLPRGDFSARAWNLRLGRYYLQLHRRATLLGLLGGFLLLALVILALGLGDFAIAPGRVLGVLLHPDGGMESTIVNEWRAPRVLAAVLFGAGLGLSGLCFQTLTRNPLATPDVIGLANGSMTGMILVLTVVGGSWPQQMLGSLLGALAAAALIYLLAFKDGLQGFRFIVVGIGLAAMFGALNTWLLLRVELEVALFAAAWGAGTLNSISWQNALPSMIVLFVACLMLLGFARGLRQLDLGHDVAQSSGVRIRVVPVLVIALAVVVVAAVTVAAGPISFIALVAPQVARRLAGTAHLPMGSTMLCGALLLLASDLIAQHLIALTVPVGVVTVVLGGLYLLWLLSSQKEGQL
ncbi:FecCD family ABC transporter permease [Glutamicibacter endophyticus]|uniref:FecCD family ABC transporter permease n=1 Tax=Glutamicibacter endophyticus TaxID=1522174 RepID=UPI003AEFEBEF